MEDDYSPDGNFVKLTRGLVAYYREMIEKLDPVEIYTTRTFAVDYEDLLSKCTDSDFAELLKNHPKEVVAACGLALTHVLDQLPQCSQRIASPRQEPDWNPEIHIIVPRLYNHRPMTALKDLKANLVNKFVTLHGTVVRVSSLRPVCLQLCHTCETCGSKQLVPCEDGRITPPTSCKEYGCKGKVFEADIFSTDNVTVDFQTIRIQEKMDPGPNAQGEAARVPRTLEVELLADLVDSVSPGDVVLVTGQVKVVSTDEAAGKHVSTGGKMGANPMYLLYLGANAITKVSAAASRGDDKDDQYGPGTVFFAEKDLYAIESIAQEADLFRLIVNSLCSAIFGHEVVKAGLLLALFGGRNRRGNRSSTGSKIRNDPHVLVVGDPGLGKSQMLSAAVAVAPRGVYVAGNAVTSTGLTVTISKDKETGDFALEAGALVLADQGCCCIDEFDKMGEHSALLEAMEQQSISIAKAGIVCSLPARTSVLAAANPVGGHYNKSKTVSENIKLDPALLSRFDLIFILLDKPDDDMDKFLSNHVMKVHSKTEPTEQPKWGQKMEGNKAGLVGLDADRTLAQRLRVEEGDDLVVVPPALLRKYIAYAKMYCHPVYVFFLKTNGSIACRLKRRVFCRIST